MREPAVHLVLRHDFVLGREEKPIHASVTQIDLHDFSRLTRTYGLAGFHCITAMQSQHQITAEILDYWQQGFGQNYNPDRSEALTKLFLHRSFEACLEQISEREGQKPVLIGTSARVFPEKNLDYQQFSSTILPLCRPVVIQFGTSWGLSAEQCGQCDWILSPIEGHDGYNHLSVRCAAAIIIDRLFGASNG